MIVGEAWSPVLGVQASEGHIVIGEGSKGARCEFEPELKGLDQIHKIENILLTSSIQNFR